MEDYSRQQRRKNASRARERQMARKRRKETLVNIKSTSVSKITDVPIPKGVPSLFTKIRLIVRDLLWVFFSRAPVFKIAGVAILGMILVFMGSYVLSSRIFPNIYAMGVALGDLTIEEAEAALQAEWDENVLIDLTIEGQVMRQVTPGEIGLAIDIPAIVANAKNLGMSGIPFGASVEPIADVAYGTAQTYLLNLTDEIYVPPFDAGYDWQDGELVAIPGRAGKQLDISLSLERISQDPVSVVANRRLELLTIDLLPTVMDSAQYLDEAYAFLTSDITLQGYDPFGHDLVAWQVGNDVASSWLKAD